MCSGLPQCPRVGRDVGRRAGERQGLGGPAEPWFSGTLGEARVEGEGRARREPRGRRTREVSRSRRSRGYCGMRQEPDRPASSKENVSQSPAGQTHPGIAPGDINPTPQLRTGFSLRAQGQLSPLEAPQDRLAGPLPAPFPLPSCLAGHRTSPQDKATHACTLSSSGYGKQKAELESLFPAPWERAAVTPPHPHPLSSRASPHSQ